MAVNGADATYKCKVGTFGGHTEDILEQLVITWAAPVLEKQ